MKMKYVYIPVIVLITLALLFQSCEGMEDNFREHVGERNYSGRIDGLTARSGFERVILSWENPTDQRSQGIRIVYGEENNVVEFPTLVNYASIGGLTTPAGREFTVFTFDRFGNLSIPISITAFPVTQSFIDRLMPPAVLVRMVGGNQNLSFVGLTTTMMRFAGGIEFTVTAPDGTVFEGYTTLPGQGAAQVNIPVSQFSPSALNPGLYRVEFRISIIPLLSGGVVTEDVVWKEHAVNVTVL